MKTNANKTSTGIKVAAPPKGAKGADRFIATFVDYSFITLLVFLTHYFFNLSDGLLEEKSIPPQLFSFIYFYFLFIIVPHTLFSQTLGKMLMKLKVVSQGKYERLNLSKVIYRDVILRPLCLVMPLSINNKNGIAAHDKFCGSVVVEAK